jgi:hypothetical protein
MRIKMLKVVVTLWLVGMANIVAADECADRTRQALTELQQVIPEMDVAQAAQAKQILHKMCIAPEPEAAQAEDSKPAAGSETPTVLGVELNKAEPDSKGHARLRRTH